MIMFYLLAKILENFDAAVFGIGNWVSGHTLKHLVASFAPLVLLGALRIRNIKTPP